MKINYENTMKIMLQGEENLARIINEIFDGFPKSLKDKINLGRACGNARKDGKYWDFEDNGEEFTLSIGKQGTTCKDIISVYLKGVSTDMIKSWPRHEGEKLIGYITFHLYNPQNRKEKPIQANYDFTVKRIEKMLVMEIKSNANASFEDVAKRLEENGLSEIHSNIIDSHYVVDLNKILKDKKR